MSQRRVLNRRFLAVPWPSAIGAGATADTLSASAAIDLREIFHGEALITLEGDVENVNFNGYVDLAFVISYDGQAYDTRPFDTLSFLFDGSTISRRVTQTFRFWRAYSVKLFSITNNDAQYELSADSVQVVLTY